MDHQELRAKNLETVKKVLEDGLGVIYPIETLYAPNAKFYQPFFFPDKVSYIHQTDAQSEYMCHEDTCAIYKDWSYEDSTIIETLDPNCFVVQNHGKGKVLRKDGKYYDYVNSYVHIFYLEDGLITTYYEYTNPLKLLDGFGIDHPDLPTPEETTETYQQLGLL